MMIEVRCPHCQGWHPLEQYHRDRTTAEKDFAYFTCNGYRYFAGSTPAAVAYRFDMRPIDQGETE